ncbi:fumarylacetoacetate hydrolase family protein [Clostridium sp. DL1XJH146]
MKIVRFVKEEQEDYGVLNEDGRILSFGKIFGEKAPTNYVEIVEKFESDYRNKINSCGLEEYDINLDEVILKSPVDDPKRGVICLGKNYREHANEVLSSMDLKGGIPTDPIYFCKLVDEPVGPNEIIPLHKELTDSLDYEAELALIIGKKGKNISKEDAEDYIFGYTILNDISVRNLQAKHVQWFRGKSVDGTCAIGPCIVTKDEIGFPVELDIKSYVNGELRQNSNTREFIFDIPFTLSDFSRETTLKVGDIISTGTPAGVGMGFKPPKFFNEGDEVVCVIEGIGELANTVK